MAPVVIWPRVQIFRPRAKYIYLILKCRKLNSQFTTLAARLRGACFFRTKTVLAESLEVAKNFRVHLAQFGDPISEISNKNFQNAGTFGKKSFS